MGEDIHSKVLVYSKIEKKYIDGLSLTTYPSESCFGPLFEGRSYSFFSLFGSTRGDLKLLKYAKYGIPNGIPETYSKYLNDSDYYGYIWWNIKNFKRSINEYIKLMRDPRRYLQSDQDDEIDEDFMLNFDEKEYDIEMNYIYKSLKQMKYQINLIEQTCEDYNLKEYIDVGKTMFLFYFDC